MGRSAITDVIFDFGGVLVDFQPRLALEGQYPPGVVDMFFDPADRFGYHYYERKANLGWSESQVLADYETQHGPAVAWVFRVLLERQRMALAGMMPGMGELLRDLDAAGIRMWGLTNFTTDYVEAARERFPELRLLSDVVVSSEEGMIKPDPRIFRRAIERFGVDPAATAFVDDKRRNADVAGLEGLLGICFTDAEQLRQELGDKGVLTK
ncbi:HAD family hydrolase [Bifidobacterium eulemuris]|uniref:HAD family phosphatase n=1 Tax=Bifidobacterium eulemuris TaxID=1765219 RepID=A0A261G9C5_9BIFI|nr:HAD family phosphatase [Bifidobacterium eulemuris]OZG68031.1 hydrolase [Bifidobacterium eulemuris]QOL31891.1 HAD family phosphatase [Bifidobacterium eulemuris]